MGVDGGRCSFTCLIRPWYSALVASCMISWMTGSVYGVGSLVIGSNVKCISPESDISLHSWVAIKTNTR